LDAPCALSLSPQTESRRRNRSERLSHRLGFAPARAVRGLRRQRL